MTTPLPPISIAEYAARVKRLRHVLPDLESDYNDDEGLTLVWKDDRGKRMVRNGETDIVREVEELALTRLRKATDAFVKEPVFAPFPPRKP